MAEKVVPIPVGAELVGEYTTSERLYVVNRRLYLLHFTMEDAIYWFDRCLTIFPLDIPSDGFYGTNFANPYVSTCGGDEYMLYVLASNVVRGDPERSSYYVDAGPECFGVQLYRSIGSIPSGGISPFGTIKPIETGFTGIIALVSRCWPEQ